jgi:alpha-tubulin suppressor-like RCC1 family protein
MLVVSAVGAQTSQSGSIVGWGFNGHGECNPPPPNTNFVAVSASGANGGVHSLGLTSDGSIVGWGYNFYGQCDVPPPNSDFVAIAAGAWYSLGLKNDGSIVAWGRNDGGQCDVPVPNSGFIAVAAGHGQSPGPEERRFDRHMGLQQLWAGGRSSTQ